MSSQIDMYMGSRVNAYMRTHIREKAFLDTWRAKHEQCRLTRWLSFINLNGNPDILSTIDLVLKNELYRSEIHHDG